MKKIESIICLSALAQDTRLDVFRLLVKMGGEGMPVSDIAETLSVNMTTLSRHLAVMEQAGLLTKERQARQIIYRVDFDKVKDLISFLVEDCCANDPRVVGSILGQTCKPKEG